jgi:hypothetical protein
MYCAHGALCFSYGLHLCDMTDTFQSFFPALKNNLPAQLSAAAMQEVNERSPTGMAIQSMMSSEESMSGTSEDTNYGHGSKTPMYSRDDSFLLSDTSVNLPTSPGILHSTKPVCTVFSKQDGLTF